MAGQPASHEGLSAIVTGASRGIGRAIAEGLANAGAQVCLAARTTNALDDTVAGIIARGGDAHALGLDVTDREDCARAVSQTQARFGKLDILINCAGRYQAAKFLDYTLGDFQDLMAINLYGAINMTQLVLPSMLERQFGRIINIASTAGKWGSMNQSAYNASKHALVGVTRCLALETAATGVTVNAICPGLVETEMLAELWNSQSELRGVPVDVVREQVAARQPIGRLLESSEIAGLAVYLTSPAAGGMTGQSILHDGGMLMI